MNGGGTSVNLITERATPLGELRKIQKKKESRCQGNVLRNVKAKLAIG